MPIRATRGRAILVAGALAACVSGAGPAAAAGGEASVYTSFDTKSCRVTSRPNVEEEDYGSWDCPGYRTVRIRIAAGDQRMLVSFGRSRDDDLAKSQTLPGFNDVYEGVVEWRLEGPNGRPFATILRWNVRKGADMTDGPTSASGRVLVVTRLGPGGVCHVGYVDARLNQDANALARRIADETARGFRCGKDNRVVLGATDPDLPLPSGPE